MNTTPDDLEQQQLMVMLKNVEPSWKVNPIPPDPSTEVYRKPSPPRPARFSFEDPFGAVEAGGTTTGGRGGSANLPYFKALFAVDTGGATFSSAEGYVYGYTT